MQANACVVTLEKISATSSVISAVERALVSCRGTVYIDLRSLPTPSAHVLDVIGEIYGSVARLAPRRNVVPLLSTAYPKGELLTSSTEHELTIRFVTMCMYYR
jgi:hypothetical protein